MDFATHSLSMAVSVAGRLIASVLPVRQHQLGPAQPAVNFEFDVECHGVGRTAQFDAIIDATKACGRRLGRDELQQAPIPVRLRDAAMRLRLPYL